MTRVAKYTLHNLRALTSAALGLSLILSLAACNSASTPVTGPTTGATVPPSGTPTRASAPTPTTAAPSPVGDGQIDIDKLFHDSRDLQYRNPVGPVPGGTDVVLKLRTAPGDLTGADIRIWNSTTETESKLPMQPAGTDMWQVTVHTPEGGAALWYRFLPKDGGTTAYYTDDLDRDGGRGEGHKVLFEDDYLLMSYRPAFKTPDWLKGGIVYQIFPDRFNNGDPKNDKPAGTFFYGDKTVTHDWGEAPTGTDDFFGGDLQGVINKLDYLKSLGVTAIYFNPIFASPSNHRYDTSDYTKIDLALGTLDTFNTLVTEAKARGIHLILDGVFNHTSSDSIYFDKYSRYPDDGAYESKSSPYFSWYQFGAGWPKSYQSWYGYDTLPQLAENSSVKNFIFQGADAITALWLKTGIGGWRLDAADQKSHNYWRDFRTAIKQQDPDAAIIGEFWHNSAPWLAGDQWDGTMNYMFKDAVVGWLSKDSVTAESVAKQLESIHENYPPQALAASMNLIDSHDTARALTTVGGDKNALRLLALLQFTYPGLPTIYYGDEVGLEGGADPDDRRTYPWGKEDQSLLDFYRTLGKVRQNSTAIQSGSFTTVAYNNDEEIYAFARKDKDGFALVAINRSKTDREIELPMQGIASNGATMDDQLMTGASYTVSGGKVKIKVNARWGALLLGK